MAEFICDGHWNNGDTLEGVVISDGDWNGLYDSEDEGIFFYTNGSPVLGNHGDFVITHIEDL
jgi:hypothetical protein